MRTAQIARDPFARASLMRQTVSKFARKPCAWCGQLGKFRYAWEQDAINPQLFWSAEVFCSVSCWRTYAS